MKFKTEADARQALENEDFKLKHADKRYALVFEKTDGQRAYIFELEGGFYALN